jgi:hypothetical protein
VVDAVILYKLKEFYTVLVDEYLFPRMKTESSEDLYYKELVALLPVPYSVVQIVDVRSEEYLTA